MEKRIEELEKRVVALEGKVQKQQKKKFIPEDSNGKHHGKRKSISRPSYY